MTDVLTNEQRSYNMSQIRAKDTKPELVIRKLLFEKGIRGYRIHYNLPGKPDIVFVRKKVVIFVDGCYWHKCPVCFIEPRTRRDFWMKKINGNAKRDKKVNELLKNEGWNVLRFWEHDVRKNPNKVVDNIQQTLKGNY